MKIKVEGIFNGCAPGSIFAVNPFGWIGKTVEIEIPYPENSIESAYKREVLLNTKLFKNIIVKDVKIVE
jgi:hypothetical protein